MIIIFIVTAAICYNIHENRCRDKAEKCKAIYLRRKWHYKRTEKDSIEKSYAVLSCDGKEYVAHDKCEPYPKGTIINCYKYNNKIFMTKKHNWWRTMILSTLVGIIVLTKAIIQTYAGI